MTSIFKVEEQPKRETSMKQDLLAACFILLFCMAYSSTLQMEAICSSETSSCFRRTARRHIPEYNSSHAHRCVKLKCIILNRLGLHDREALVRFPAASITSHFPTECRPAVGSTHLTVIYVPVALFSEVKRPGREANYLTPRLRICVELYLLPVKSSWYLIKHRDLIILSLLNDQTKAFAIRAPVCSRSRNPNVCVAEEAGRYCRTRLVQCPHRPTHEFQSACVTSHSYQSD